MVDKKLSEEPTRKQLVSACVSFDHGYLIMDEEDQKKLEWECKEWWRAIAREINYPSQHPMIKEFIKRQDNP